MREVIYLSEGKLNEFLPKPRRALPAVNLQAGLPFAGFTVEKPPIHVRITQAEALFDEGLIVEAMPRFASLARELDGLGSEHTAEAARCRLRLARCLTNLGHHQEALKDLLALADALRPCGAPDDRLLLDVRFQVGQLLLDLGDQHGISELAEVYRALTAANRPEDAAMTAEVRRALTRATLG